MIKWECETNGNVETCQVPYNEEGLSGIVDFLLLIFLGVFLISAVFRLLSRFFR